MFYAFLVTNIRVESGKNLEVHSFFEGKIEKPHFLFTGLLFAIERLLTFASLFKEAFGV